MWLFLKSTHLVHPIKLVHPWKILVHPRVYDTPGWQALLLLDDNCAQVVTSEGPWHLNLIKHHIFLKKIFATSVIFSWQPVNASQVF